MESSQGAGSRGQRGLLLRDTFTFLILCSVTATMFGLTLLLFRSFERHREELGQRWAERGAEALQQGRAGESVAALRTALSYSPNDWDDQLELAKALAQAGRTEEATNYFLTLWDARPGDGLVNLELARLALKRGNAQEATNYYRASIYGNWNGDGTARRREVRLELADFLASRGDVGGARTEVLIAAGNAPARENLEVVFGDRLQALGDPGAALKQYRAALDLDPHNPVLLEKAGRTAYAMRDYGVAYKLLTAALGESRRSREDDARAKLRELAENARRAPELNLSRDLPATERAEHLMHAVEIAERRMARCSAMLGARAGAAGAGVGGETGAVVVPVELQPVQARWTAVKPELKRRTLERDAALSDSVAALVSDTETTAARVCGAPSGEDALLLTVAGTTPGEAP
ncbi:MAG TPA: tetratricopeptide repeat protein [Acidobacteriaceae bacterium]|jgi:tetratricopeptide (TPR) repeat protein|nr:tetratricopeptide repeat protein [Acidobacteriaceae bacterium]